MREFFDDLRRAVETHDPRLLADAAETLLFLMQQHNSREESVLYPMADRMLSDDLLARFNDLKASG
jgi:hemerythrin-like domain-containing protein